MDLSLLEIVKDKLVTAKNLADVYDCFTECFGEDPEFFEIAVPARNKVVEGCLAQIVGDIAGKKKAAVAALMLLSLPDEGFLFGGFEAGKSNGNFIYFEDIHMGLVMAQGPTIKGTLYARFSGMPLIKPDDVSRN